MTESDNKNDQPEERPPIALCMAGGGITGWLYEVGVLAALDDLLGDEFQVTDFDIIIGTSAGGIMGALVANGVSPETVYKSVLKHRQTYLSLQSSDFYSVSFKNLWLSLKVVVKETVRGVLKWIAHPFRTKFFNLIWRIQESLPPGVFSVDRMHRFLKYVMIKNRLVKDFRKLDKLFLVTATDLDTGERFVFGKGYEEEVPIYTAITASACIPMFFKPVNIKGHDLVDGGVGPVASLDLALDHGAKLVFAVNPVVPVFNDRKEVRLPGVSADGGAPYVRDKGPAKVGDQILKIDNQVKFRMGLELIQAKYPTVDVVVVKPDPKDTLMFMTPSMNLDKRIQVVNHGYDSAVKYFTEHFDEMETVFGKLGISVTMDKFERGKMERKSKEVRKK